MCAQLEIETRYDDRKPQCAYLSGPACAQERHHADLIKIDQRATEGLNLQVTCNSKQTQSRKKLESRGFGLERHSTLGPLEPMWAGAATCRVTFERN